MALPCFIDHAEASYSSDTGQLFGEGTLPLTYAATSWEPFASLSYVRVETSGFTESGGAAALTTTGADDSLGYSTLGVRAAMTTRIAGALLTPHALIAWQHAIGDIDPAATLSFASGGAAFTVLGAPLALAPNATLGIGYSGQLAGDVTDNAVTGRLDWRF